MNRNNNLSTMGSSGYLLMVAVIDFGHKGIVQPFTGFGESAKGGLKPDMCFHYHCFLKKRFAIAGFVAPGNCRRRKAGSKPTCAEIAGRRPPGYNASYR